VTLDQKPAVAIEPIVSYCTAGECPTIYRTDRGTLVVQGYAFEPETEMPAGERMIEIPVELLAEYTRTTR
jgi:hypothetical protein